MSASRDRLEQGAQDRHFRAENGLRGLNDAELFGDPFRHEATAQAIVQLAVRPEWVAEQRRLLARLESLSAPRSE